VEVGGSKIKENTLILFIDSPVKKTRRQRHGSGTNQSNVLRPKTLPSHWLICMASLPQQIHISEIPLDVKYGPKILMIQRCLLRLRLYDTRLVTFIL